MPMESAFLPSQSAFPGLPLPKESSKTINTANLSVEECLVRGRELHVVGPAPHQPAHQVDAEIVAGEGPLGALLLQAVAQGGADAGQQLVGAKGLGDVVVGAGIERRDLGRLVAAAR